MRCAIAVFVARSWILDAVANRLEAMARTASGPAGKEEIDMALVRWQPKGSLSRWTPFHELEEMRNEMSRMFGWPADGADSEGFLDSLWSPAVDIVQEGDHFVVKADLPGMKKDDIEITLNGDTLTISGEKKREDETKSDGCYRRERYYGKFSRSLVLPSSIDTSRIEATYKDGVLSLTVPKSEEARPKQIKIQS
jgi:HSP20 family protein